MRRIIAVYGIIGGVIVAIGMQIGIRLAPEGGAIGMIVGYLTMLVALTMVFVGVKRYRDTAKGGVIRFLPALAVGLGIAFVSSLFYVAAWEAYMYLTGYSFMDKYIASALKTMQAEGKSTAEIARFSIQMDALKTSYADPVTRMVMTFAEIAPVGLVMAVLSAAILRSSRVFPARAPRI